MFYAVVVAVTVLCYGVMLIMRDRARRAQARTDWLNEHPRSAIHHEHPDQVDWEIVARTLNAQWTDHTDQLWHDLQYAYATIEDLRAEIVLFEQDLNAVEQELVAARRTAQQARLQFLDRIAETSEHATIDPLLRPLRALPSHTDTGQMLAITDRRAG